MTVFYLNVIYFSVVIINVENSCVLLNILFVNHDTFSRIF